MVRRAPRIRAVNLSKVFKTEDGQVQAVHDISLTLEPGTLTALVGYSGCGKTTLLRLLADLETPTKGRVERDPISSIPSVVFQDPRLLPWLTVRKNLLLGLRRFPAERTCENRVRDSLQLVGLDEYLNEYPHTLSGGMAQRVGLARALSQESGFLLMDEPFSALDALTREKLQVRLKNIRSRIQSTTLFITHDVGEALFLSDRILIMKAGIIVGDLTTEELRLEKRPEDALVAMMDESTVYRQTLVD